MKGIQGLAIAGAMGVVGAVCNWFYISQRARDLEKIDFVYIKSDARVNEGQKFQEKHFGKVSIPKKHLGDLEKVAVLWKDRLTAVGYTAQRSFTANELLLREDLRTLTRKSVSELLGPDEISRTVLIDSTAFIASNVNPTDRVLFFPPTAVRDAGSGGKSKAAGAGPFRILAIGNRLGSTDVAKAAGLRPSRGNSITVPLTYKDGKHDAKSQKLLDLIAASGGKGLTVSVVSAQSPRVKK